MVSVSAAELKHAIQALRTAGDTLTHLAVEAPQGMPAMNPRLEYSIYHELRNIGLEMGKLAREIYVDAAVQEARLLQFGMADESVTSIAGTLLTELGRQSDLVQEADRNQPGLDRVLNTVDRAEHFGEGLVDFGKGLLETGAMLAQSLPEYGMVDSRGHEEAVRRESDIVLTLLKASPMYAMWSPTDYLRNNLRLGFGMFGGEYLWNGDTDRWAGNIFPQVALAVISDGASEAAVAPTEASESATAAAEGLGAARAPLGSAGDLPDLVAMSNDLNVPMPGLKDALHSEVLQKAWDYWNNVDTFAHSPITLPWETGAATAPGPAPAGRLVPGLLLPRGMTPVLLSAPAAG